MAIDQALCAAVELGGTISAALWVGEDGVSLVGVMSVVLTGRDVVVEGVSLVVTQRAEFASVLQHNSGSVPALTALLRDKIAELKKKA